jgi:feruloyl esterase
LAVVGAALAAPEAQTATPQSDAAARCAAILSQAGSALGEPTARVVTARLNAPGRGMPEHCEVMGVMRERTAADGQRYAVNFRLRLPTVWNGRFLFSGGGGLNGMVSAATGGFFVPHLGSTPLERGYAVVATDTGHDMFHNRDPRRQGMAVFGHDYEARLEYAEKALDSVATTSKRLVAIYYGQAPQRSYFAGCSNGGREGMMFAQRFPQQFDGIVANAPGMAVPKVALAETAEIKAFAGVAQRAGYLQANGLPDLSRALSAADLKLVGQAVTQSCDTLDGLADGMVQNFQACTTKQVRPALRKITCVGPKNDTCLTPDQIAAMVLTIDGVRDAKGAPVYAQFSWDPGLATEAWRNTKFGSSAAPPASVSMIMPALSAVLITPPTPRDDSVETMQRYAMNFDIARDGKAIYATAPGFPRSGWDLMATQSTDLKTFKGRGGRMILAQGAADPLLSMNDLANWWRGVDRKEHGRAARFVRVFNVPGGNHCEGGPATFQFDPLDAVVAWVEEGATPDQMLATAGGQTPWPGRTRPLCAFPAIAQYQGGDKEKAESFVCRRPNDVLVRDAIQSTPSRPSVGRRGGLPCAISAHTCY